MCIVNYQGLWLEYHLLMLCWILYQIWCFHIAGHEQAWWTIGPRTFRAKLAWKSTHVSYLGRQVVTVSCGGMAWWHAGHTGLCPIGPCLARAHAMLGSGRSVAQLYLRPSAMLQWEGRYLSIIFHAMAADGKASKIKREKVCITPSKYLGCKTSSLNNKTRYFTP